LSEVWAQAEQRRLKLSQDPITFFERVMGFKPTAYQEDLAKRFVENQFVAICWSRQSGKGWIAAALLLNYALTHLGSYIGIVAPGWRQSKLVIRRIHYFLQKLPKEICPRPQRTVLYFSNGDFLCRKFARVIITKVKPVQRLLVKTIKMGSLFPLSSSFFYDFKRFIKVVKVYYVWVSS